jgi:ADP-ribose pyrophosphatase YjhB (NUDIX family)
MNNGTIEVIARAIITDETKAKILFCSPKDHTYFYLPGGHVAFGETATTALIRELYEETGKDASETGFHFVGAAENIFKQGHILHHEINMHFEVKEIFSGNQEVLSLEEEISFHWRALTDIPNLPILPARIKDFLSEWTTGKKIVWGK